MSALEDLLAAVDDSRNHDEWCQFYAGSTCVCRMRPLVELAARVRAEMVAGELSDQTLLELFYAEDMSPGEVLRGLRAVEAAVRRRVLGE